MVERTRVREGSERGREVHDTSHSTRDRSSSRGGREESQGRSGNFKYQKPSAEDVRKRASQKGGADFDSIFVDTVKVFKVNDGSNCIRIIPATWEEPKHFGFDIFVHWNIGPDKQSYLCLKENKGEPCPICEERAKAIKQGDDDYAKELKPSKRVLVYLIDRDNEKEGVQAWSMPWTVDRDINSLIVDKRTGEVLGIDDPENGYDIEFDRKGKAPKIEYIGMQIARHESPLGKDAWLEYAEDHPLPDTLKYFSYDHIADVFGGLSSKKDKADDFEGQDRKLRDKEIESTRSSKSEPSLPTWDEVHSMTYEELCSLVEAENLDIKADDSVDDEELASWICEDLKISKRAARESTRRDSKEAEESPRDKLRSMRRREE